MKSKFLVILISMWIVLVSTQKQLRNQVEEVEIVEGLQSSDVNVTEELHCEVRQDPIIDDITNPKNHKHFTPKQVEPFCVDFNREDEFYTEGFDACPGYYDNVEVKHSILNPYSDGIYGQNGSGDYYLHLRDTSGASLACGSSGPYVGDWSNFVCKDDSCYDFCFDMIIHSDGCTSSNPACDQTNNGVAYVNIKPRIIVQGGAPNYYRAAFAANIEITDPDGINGGWKRICAPLRPLKTDGTLPSNDQGQWTMGSAPCNSLGGTNCAGTIVGVSPNTAWCDLWKDVTAINLLIDPTPNPAERFGYDNICLEKNDNCDSPPVCEPQPLCYWQYEYDCTEVEELQKWGDVLKREEVRYFDENSCPCKIMEQHCPDRCEMAEQEYMSLLLNIASGKLDWECCVEECSKQEITVQEAVKNIDRLMRMKPRSDSDCTEVLSIATGINYGTSLCGDPSYSPSAAPSAIPSFNPSTPTREVVQNYAMSFKEDISNVDDTTLEDAFKDSYNNVRTSPSDPMVTNVTLLQRQVINPKESDRRMLSTVSAIFEVTSFQTGETIDIFKIIDNDAFIEGFTNSSGVEPESVQCSGFCPSESPSISPSLSPSHTFMPSGNPSVTMTPTLSKEPSSKPSQIPSIAPSSNHSSAPTTGAKGDPHFTTWLGKKYDFHGICDLVLLQNHGFRGIGMNIHIRTKKTRLWSYISAAVVRIGGDILEVRGGQDKNKYWINKAQGDLLEKDEMVLPTAIGRYPIKFKRLSNVARQFTIELGNEEKVILKTWNAMVSVNINGGKKEDFQNSLGLMGTFDHGFLMGRNNQTIFEDLNEFGLEWQVKADEPVLFHNVEGPQAPKKCEIPSSSEMRRRLGELQVSISDAEIACAHVNTEDFDFCVFDAITTNNLDVAGAY